MRKYQIVNIRCFVAQPNGRGLAPCFVPMGAQQRLVPVKKDQAELELGFDVAEPGRPLVPDDSIGYAPDDPFAFHIEHSYSIARFGLPVR